MKPKIIYLHILFLFLPIKIFALDARQIIRLVDRNQNIHTSRFFGGMTINKYGKKLEKRFNGYGHKRSDRFFMRFTNPADKGVKYLKIKKQLWIYLPDMDDVIRVSGHMLRRGMMGSDISYEDLLHFDDFDKKYSAKLMGKKKIRGRICYDIIITAKTEDVTYYKQRILVDSKRFVLLEMRMYARSGRLLKKMSHSMFRYINGHYFPMKIVVRDMRRNNSFTTVRYTRIFINRAIPARIFTRRNLFR